MLIEVTSNFEDSCGIVDASLLEMLIKNGTIKTFKRKHGWVIVEKHQIRKNCGDYNGPERRKIIQVLE